MNIRLLLPILLGLCIEVNAQKTATVGTVLNKARMQLLQIKEPEANLTVMITQLNKMIDDMGTNLNEQKSFLNKYLATPKFFRKGLFTTYVK